MKRLLLLHVIFAITWNYLFSNAAGELQKINNLSDFNFASVEENQYKEYLDAPAVQTQCGTVIGNIRSNLESPGTVYEYLGIPYAASPIGSRRWKMPTAIYPDYCYSNNFEAKKFGSKCAQQSVIVSNKLDGQEDCLFLNIYTPNNNPSALLPVLFYIHGGGLMGGSGADDYNNPINLSNQLNIVSVTVNYRLSAFGFLALSELSLNSSTKTSGNYGLADQIEALRFIKENIKYFGGDPNKITVAGQSSGGTSIFGLLATDQAEGLFQRAWIMSASPLFEKSLEEASADNRIFIESAGCNNSPSILSCLYNLTASQIVASVPYNVYPYWSTPMLMDFPQLNYVAGGISIVDGFLIKQKPKLKLQSAGWHKYIPTVWGSMAQENDVLPVQNFESSSSTVEEVKQFISGRIMNITGLNNSIISEEAFLLYQNITQNLTPQCFYETLSSDSMVRCGLHDVASAHSIPPAASSNAANDSDYPVSSSDDSSINVYRYVVSSGPSNGVSVIPFIWKAFNAFHLFDLLALFRSALPLNKPNSDTNTIKLGEVMGNHFYSFMVNGSFDGMKGSAEWERFSPARHSTWTYYIVNGTDQSFLSLNDRDQVCNFWTKYGFDKYQWTN